METPLVSTRNVMTDTNIKTQNVDALTGQETVPQKNSRLSMVLTLFSLVLSLCVIGVGYYIYHTNQSNNQVYQQQNQALATKLAAQSAAQQSQFQTTQSANNQLKRQVEQLTSQLVDVQNKNKLYSSDVQSLQRSFAEKNVRHPTDWILSEIEYLINLSGRKLWLEHDLTTTTALLKAADQRVIEMRDPSLNPLRRALLEDINMIELLPEHDIDSTVLKLSSLGRRIDKLVISRLEVPAEEVAEIETLTDDVSDWKSNLKKSWNTFVGRIVVISHREKGIEALLSPKQAWYLKENVRNNLAKAEFAIYREQQATYDMALSNVLSLLDQYFDMTDKSNQDFYAAIVALSEQKVNFIYPDQFKSAPLLAQIIKQRLTKSLIIKDAE